MRTQVIVGLCLCLSLVEAHGDEHSPRFKRSIYEVHFKTLTFLNISKLISSPAEINSPSLTRTRTSGYKMEKMSSKCHSRRHQTLILQRLIFVNCQSDKDHVKLNFYQEHHHIHLLLRTSSYSFSY